MPTRDTTKTANKLKDDGSAGLQRVAGDERDAAAWNRQTIEASEKLKSDASWRWALLKNLAEAVRQEATDPDPEKRAHGKKLDPVRAALAKLIANKGN